MVDEPAARSALSDFQLRGIDVGVQTLAQHPFRVRPLGGAAQLTTTPDEDATENLIDAFKGFERT